MTPQAVIVPPKLVDVRAATAAEYNMLRGSRGKNTCSQWADRHYWCVGDIVIVPAVAIEPKLVNVTVGPLVVDML